MDADLLRAWELQSLVKRELSRTVASPSSGSSPPALVDGAAFGLPELSLGSASAAALQHVYEERPDLAACRSHIAHATQSSLDVMQCNALRADPSLIAFAIERLFQCVMEEPQLRGHFQQVDTGRLHHMLNSAVCRCVYQVCT